MSGLCGPGHELRDGACKGLGKAVEEFRVSWIRLCCFCGWHEILAYDTL